MDRKISDTSFDSKYNKYDHYYDDRDDEDHRRDQERARLQKIRKASSGIKSMKKG